jgi:type II secretory pathway pseudopilin PulG
MKERQNKIHKRKTGLSRQGQTLIETLVAIFILVMGITAAVGLAIYAFSTSTNVTKQIIATGLAREGLEAVRSIRDTNWLKQAQNPGIDKNCYNFSSTPIGSTSPDALTCPGTSIGGRCCYKIWIGDIGYWNNPNKPDRGYNFGLSGTSTYALSPDPDKSHKTWNWPVSTTKYGLDFKSDIDSGSFNGYYVPNTTVADGNSGYYRKITIVPVAGAPFNVSDYGSNGSRIRVISQVWWTDKKCPAHPDWVNDGKCSVQLETELTNWKNY